MGLLRAGIPVLGEKPISNEIPKAREMVALAAEKAGALRDQPESPLHARGGQGQGMADQRAAR